MEGHVDVLWRLLQPHLAAIVLSLGDHALILPVVLVMLCWYAGLRRNNAMLSFRFRQNQLSLLFSVSSVKKVVMRSSVLWRKLWAPREVIAVTSGALETDSWAVGFQSKVGKESISPWHSIHLTTAAKDKEPASPLDMMKKADQMFAQGFMPTFNLDLKFDPIESSGELLTFVNEIPKGTRAKNELSTKVARNPIKQDKVKKTGALRFFSYGDIPFNYGTLPRTWENPSELDESTGCKGDGDPLDVVELGPKREVGELVSVRMLGILAMIDEGETDWKLIVSAADNDTFKTLKDVPVAILDEIRSWFRFYKTTDGKPENEFAFGGSYRDADFAAEIVSSTHRQYLKGVMDKAGFEKLGYKF